MWLEVKEAGQEGPFWEGKEQTSPTCLSLPNSGSLFEDLHRSVTRESELKSAKKGKRGSQWPTMGVELGDFSAPSLVLYGPGSGSRKGDWHP